MQQSDRAPVTRSCRKCAKTGCSSRCARCKTTFYCSKECQREDWKKHKLTDCKDSKLGNKNNTATPSEDTDQGEQHRRPLAPFSVPMFSDPVFPFRSPEMVHFEAARPLGSLEKAKQKAELIANRRSYSAGVIDDLDDVLIRPFSVFRDLWMKRCRSTGIFVAFMFKYDPYAIRHGVYIKDRKDKVASVVFTHSCNLGSENPFSYGQVKPGNYLCLLNPRTHTIMDSPTRILVDDQSKFFIIDGQSVT